MLAYSAVEVPEQLAERELMIDTESLWRDQGGVER